jgi:hypothetical protein
VFVFTHCKTFTLLCRCLTELGPAAPQRADPPPPPHPTHTSLYHVCSHTQVLGSESALVDDITTPC